MEMVVQFVKHAIEMVAQDVKSVDGDISDAKNVKEMETLVNVKNVEEMEIWVIARSVEMD